MLGQVLRYIKNGWDMIKEAHELYWLAGVLGLPAAVPAWIGWDNPSTRGFFISIGILLWAILFLCLLGYYGYRAERQSLGVPTHIPLTKNVSLSLKMQIGDARLHDMTNVQSVRHLKTPDGTESVEINLWPWLDNIKAKDLGHTTSAIFPEPARIRVELKPGEKLVNVKVTGTVAATVNAPTQDIQAYAVVGTNAEDGRVLIHDAARLAYEAVERTGLKRFALRDDYSSPEVALSHFKHAFRSRNIQHYGVRPPSTQSLPIPNEEYKYFYPADGESTWRPMPAYSVSGYHHVTITRRDLLDFINEYTARLKRLSDENI